MNPSRSLTAWSESFLVLSITPLRSSTIWKLGSHTKESTRSSSLAQPAQITVSHPFTPQRAKGVLNTDIRISISERQARIQEDCHRQDWLCAHVERNSLRN
jgi:hypothetical protein